MSQSSFKVIKHVASRLILEKKLDFVPIPRRFQVLDAYSYLFLRGFSCTGIKREKLNQDKSSRLILLGELERSLREHRVDEAWKTYKEFKCLYGFPNQHLMAGLMTELSYSSDSKCLRRACDLLLSISKEKPGLLHPDVMTKLLLASVRAQMSVPASNILRIMIEKRNFPPVDILEMIFLHMVKTETGTYLASNILVEICGPFLKRNENKSIHIELKKPSTLIFNLVLDACVRFGASLKGQQIIETMAQIGVVADAHTVTIIAQIYEMNGMRDELKKFKEYVDQVPVAFACYYRQFYDCLLSLHLTFNDMNAASELVMELCRDYKTTLIQVSKREPHTLYAVSIGSQNMRTGFRLLFSPLKFQKDHTYTMDHNQGLIMFKNGKFYLSKKSLAKLILGYKRCGRIGELSKLLISIQNNLNLSGDNSLCSNVIGACIHLGWLETAHDILDDLEIEKYPIRESAYVSLLAAYYGKKMFKEAEAMVKQMRKCGLVLDSSPEKTFSSCTSESEDGKLHVDDLYFTCNLELSESITRNMREEKVTSSLVHVYNSSIYFFTKAKMIGDALKTYQKMQERKVQPTVSTFFHLILGYASLGMYREITILWGDIKRSMGDQNSRYNRDLYELLLLNFLRGGYFERVMEVISLMMENGMYLDKWGYKNEFLKFHGDLYRSLTVADATNEVQSKRVELVRAFKKWVGIG